MNSQLVLVEYNLCRPYICHVESKDAIDVKSVAKHFTYHKNFDEDTDSITFIDPPSINIDTMEV